LTTQDKDISMEEHVMTTALSDQNKENFRNETPKGSREIALPDLRAAVEGLQTVVGRMLAYELECERPKAFDVVEACVIVTIRLDRSLALIINGTHQIISMLEKIIAERKAGGEEL
jgi:hypothetical protein